MKLKITLLVFFCCLSTIAQKIDKVDSIDYNTLIGLTNSKEYRNNLKLNEYKTKAGDLISIGDTLLIGKPSNMTNLTQGTAVTGQGIANHSFIYLGTGAAALTGTFMMGNEGMLNDRVFVIGISAGRISKKNDFEVYLEINKVGGGRFLGTKKLARVLLEKALDSGELINPKASMTRDEAITKLKEAKELLDLEMMTQEEYNTLKNKLSPIIKGK